MAYGIVKVDNITFDNGGSDQNVTVSGLYRATTSGVTVSGTIAATTVSGVTIIGSTTVSGATVTGTTANFTSGNFTNLISAAATMSGALIMANQQQVRFREAVGNGVNHIALQAPAIISADQTITLPDQTGTVVTTGDNGSVTSTMILDGTILNADINASAAIAGTKISPDFGSQTIVTTGVHSAAAGSATTPSIAFTGDLNTGIYSPGANQLAVATNGTGRLFVDANGRVGIGVSAPNDDLEIRDAVAAIRLTDSETLETTRIVQDFQTTQIINSGTGDIRFSNNGSERVRITSAGLVGIGTSAPATLLEIASNATNQTLPGIPTLRITNTDTTAVANDNVGSVEFFSKDASDPGVVTGFVRNIATTAGTTYDLTFGTKAVSIGSDATEKVRITGAGNVGIGTSTPTYLLQAAGTIASVNPFGNFAALQAAGGTGFRWTLSNDGTFALQRTTDGFATAQYPIFVDSSSRVGIGTTSPSEALNVVGNILATGRVRSKDGTTGDVGLGFTDDHNLGLYRPASDTLGFVTGSSERLRIDSSGRLLVGTSTAFNLSGGFGFGFYNCTVNGSGAFARFTNDANGPEFEFAKSRNTTQGSHTVVNGSDNLGAIKFVGSDGTAFRNAAQILCQVDGTPGANDMPGRLVFSTTADGASSPTERMRITSAGNVGIGTTSPATTLDVNGNVTISDKIIHAGDTDTAIRFPGVNTVTVETSGSERVRVTSSGNLLVGTTSAVSVNGLPAGLELHALATTNGASASIARFGSDPGTVGPQLNFGKSRSGTLSPGTAVQDDDILGEISFCGDDGTDLNSRAARIACEIDGIPGADDMPGRLVFYATPSGSSSPIETMRLRGNGFVSALGVYSNTTAVAANVNVDSNGLMRRSTSSVKYKTDIETLQDSYADALLSCRPVWYRSTCENDNPSWGWWGFIAEEVAAIDPRLVQWKTVKVTYDENGSAVETPCNPEPEGVAYDRFVPHLLNLIKRQQQAIETLEAGNTDLLARVSALESA
jgi:hypothetical protein